MPVDYNTPKWTIRQAAVAAGYELNTLRSFYNREHFKIIGGEAAKARGLAGLLSLRDVMHLAVARSLIDLGLHPAKAFRVGLDFAHSGDEERLPAGMFDIHQRGETLLVYWPDDDTCDVMASDDVSSLYDLRISTNQPHESAIILRLNYLEHRIFRALGISPMRIS